ncbi:Putative pentatricopeptide repeat-containing protein [Raphanus sativus]|nr:Putative pentatricopeptide repeat-containing protein [Raphanus sativus]
MASAKFFSFALLLVLVLATNVEGYGIEGSGSLCCNTHPKFGKCNPSNDKERQQQRQLHRPITTKLDSNNNNNTFLPPNQSELAQNLITIFTTRQPLSPSDPDLLRLAPELNTKVVETVLNGFKRWAPAHLFFSWASKQQGYRNDMYAYNAMASILSRARQNASLKALVRDVLNSRCHMSPGGLGFLIRCLGDAGLAEEASFVFDRAREMGLCVPNVYTYNCLLEAISKSRSSSVGLVEEKLEEMRRCGFDFDKYTLTPVLRVYCNAGEFERALSVFDEVRGRGWLDEHISTVLVVSFCKWGKVDEAFELVEMLEERGIRLNYKTCCVLVHGFVKECRVDKGLLLFEKMRGMGMEGDIALYDVLIGGLCKVKDLEKALSLYLEMKESGVIPDRGILGKLIRSFSEESELSRIMKVIIGDIDTKYVMVLYKNLLEGFVRNDLVHDAYSFVQSLLGNHESDGESEIVKLLKDHDKAILPDSDTLNSVIDCLVKANKIDMAVRLLHVIVQNGFNPSLMMYNNIIEGLCREGKLEESLRLLEEMKEPSQFTLNCIYGCLAERCDVAGAVDLLKKMRFYGLEPWIKHSTFLVKKLCENGRAVDACKYLDDVAGEGFSNHMVAYTAAVDGLIKNEGVDRGLELFRDICASGHSPDVIAYNVLIKALCKASRTTEADSLFNEMVSKGLKPSVATYNSMIDGWCKEGDIDRAMSCIGRMYEDEKDPDVITYTSLIHGLCVSGRPSEAISRWNEMKSRDCCPNIITYMALIQGLCKCGWSSEALVYFREMEEKEMEPDSAVYLSLVCSFLSSENISTGFEIFREMVCKGRFPILVDRNYLVAVDATNKFVEDYRTSCYVTGLVKDGRLPVVAASDAMDPALSYTAQGCTIWNSTSMLDARINGCIKHGNLELAETVGKKLVKLQACNRIMMDDMSRLANV